MGGGIHSSRMSFKHASAAAAAAANATPVATPPTAPTPQAPVARHGTPLVVPSPPPVTSKSAQRSDSATNFTFADSPLFKLVPEKLGIRYNNQRNNSTSGFYEGKYKVYIRLL